MDMLERGTMKTRTIISNDCRTVKQLGCENIYDTQGRLVEIRYNNGNRKYWSYDERTNNVIKIMETWPDVTIIETREYNQHNKIVNVQKNMRIYKSYGDITEVNIDTMKYEYDDKNRLIHESINGDYVDISYTSDGSIEKFSNGYCFMKDNIGNIIKASNREEEWTVEYGDQSLPIKFICNDGREKHIKYAEVYDDDGYISYMVSYVIYRDGIKETKYNFEYDDMGHSDFAQLYKITRTTSENVDIVDTKYMHIWSNNIDDKVCNIDWGRNTSYFTNIMKANKKYV